MGRRENGACSVSAHLRLLKLSYGPDAGAPEAARTRVAQFSLSGTSYRNSGNETSTQLVIN